MKVKLIIGLGLVLVAFLVGWYPEYSKRVEAEKALASTQDRLKETEQSLALFSFRNRAALLMRQADSNDYATAGQEATRFFTDLRAHANKLPPGPAQQGFESILSRRDSIIAGLAKADPAVKAELNDLFMEMQKI